MKTFILCCAAAIFTFSTQLNAQSELNLDELLSRLNQNIMGSISDVFTQEEITVLQAHFSEVNKGQEVANTRLGGGKEMFSPEVQNDTFGHFEAGMPEIFNKIGTSNTLAFDGAGAYNPVSGTFFVTDNDGNVYDVHPGTGVYTFLGNLSMMPPGESIVGLEFDPTDMQLYALSTDGGGNTALSTVNTSTYEMTKKGNTGLTLGIALGFDNFGLAYAYDIDDDNMYTINKENGVASLLGSIGFDATGGQGMALNRATGNLYLAAFNATSFQSELRMVNTTTGNTTNMGAIGSTSPGGLLQFGWTSVWDENLGSADEAFSNFNFYPNPVSDRLNVSASSEISVIRIYNVLGQQVVHAKIDRLNGSVDLSGLETGSYYMSVQIDGKQQSYPLIKN